MYVVSFSYNDSVNVYGIFNIKSSYQISRS